MTTSTTQERITPLQPPYEPEIGDMLAKWMPPNAPMEPLKLFRVMAHNPELMNRMRPLGAGFLGKGSLIEPRHRELVINRVCARCGCEYEWGVHVAAFGTAFGLPPETLQKTAQAHFDPHDWSPEEALLIRLVDQLHGTSQINDALWQDLAEQWTTPQILELVALVGWYHVIAFIANAAQVSLEDWGARFPA